MKKTTARQNDTISQICYREYGSARGMVEQVLTANPQLCHQAPILPMGAVVYLPSAPVQKAVVNQRISLWD